MGYGYDYIELRDFIEQVMLELSPFLAEGAPVHFDLTVAAYPYVEDGKWRGKVVLPTKQGAIADAQKISFAIRKPASERPTTDIECDISATEREINRNAESLMDRIANGAMRMDGDGSFFI